MMKSVPDGGAGMHGVAIYIRWSTEDQGQGTTLAVQLEGCRRYCDQQGWHVPDERCFIDDGYSGGTLHRPAMSRLRAAVQSGEVRVVVAYRLDRLSRNLADAATLLDREWKGRALVRSATEDVLPERDEGWLNYSFRATFADYERRIIRQRTLGGKLRRLREGRKVQGGAPFGWQLTHTPGMLAVDEPAAGLMRTLFRKCVYENMGGPALARWANAQGIRPPKGQKWYGCNVTKLLSNPVYGGQLAYGRRRSLKASRVEAGPWEVRQEPTLLVEADPACLPPIIPRDLWEQAKAALQQRSRRFARGRGVTHPCLLTGILYCPCGGKLKHKRSRGTRTGGNGFRYYRCWRNDNVEPCQFNGGYIAAPAIETYVEAFLLSRVQAQGFLAGLAQALGTRRGNDAAVLKGQIEGLRLEMGRLDRQLAFIDREYLAQEITIGEARRLRGQVEEERAASQIRLDALAQALQADSRYEMYLKVLRAQLSLVAGWHRLSVLEKKAVLPHFIRRIEALRTHSAGAVKVTLYWTFAPDGAPAGEVEPQARGDWHPVAGLPAQPNVW